jgi:hypothetical protein
MKSKQLCFAFAPAWSARFPGIWRVIETWPAHPSLAPWGDLSSHRVVRIQRRCHEFVICLESNTGHRWHIVFFDDRAYGSGAGWKRDGNDVDTEELLI